MGKAVAIIGTGPAALMAAAVLAGRGHTVSVFEKSKGPGRKLLIAGGSGLNISNALPLDIFAAQYEGAGINWQSLLERFSPARWLEFIHQKGFETFEGTSGRYFIREMKASGLLRTWLADLRSKNVRLHFSHEITDFTRKDAATLQLHFGEQESVTVNAIIFALGGASWLAEDEVPAWPDMFKTKGIVLQPFAAANSGFEVGWKKEFLKEALNQPLKNIILSTARGSKKGDLLITAYGLEGTPVYTCGTAGFCHIDLKPDLTQDQIIRKLESVRENLSPLRRAQRILTLSPAALALLYHEAPQGRASGIKEFVDCIKAFPITLLHPRPLAEAISSAGGIALEEITEEFELKKIPGVYAVGEMLDWSAPTGGFLIQACVSQGFVAANALLQKLT